MKELHHFEIAQLKNLLAQETIKYYKLIGYGASIEECTQCNIGIRQIQMELDLRRKQEEENSLEPLHAAEKAYEMNFGKRQLA